MSLNKITSLCKNKFSKSVLHKKLAKGVPFPAELSHNYFITTDLGILHIASGKCQLLTKNPGYGLAINGVESIYSFEMRNFRNRLSSESRLVVVYKKDLFNGVYLKRRKLKKAKAIYKQPFRSNNGRIHQISYNMSENWGGVVTLTEENCILYFTKTRSLKKIFPFTDRFGSAIKNFDHNHINSAIFIDGVIYFVAYKAGKTSLIGFLKDGSVYGWQPKPRGFHDLYPTATGFITCDTFGNEEHGRVLTEKGPICPEYFQKYDFAPRGVAGDEKELLIGHSHKGPRNKRFKGKGGIIIMRNNCEPEYIQLPAAQVYQIVREDGGHLISPNKCTHKVMVEQLNQSFGAAVYIGPYLEEDFSVA